MLRVCEKASFAKQARRGAISRFSFLFLLPFRLSLLAFSSEYIDEFINYQRFWSWHESLAKGLGSNSRTSPGCKVGLKRLGPSNGMQRL